MRRDGRLHPVSGAAGPAEYARIVCTACSRWEVKQNPMPSAEQFKLLLTGWVAPNEPAPPDQLCDTAGVLDRERLL